MNVMTPISSTRSPSTVNTSLRNDSGIHQKPIRSKRSLLSSALAALLVGATMPSMAGATVISFDDLDGWSTNVAVHDGYYDFNWDNFFALNGSYGGGYGTGTVSPLNVVYNGWAQPATISGSQFDFNGAYLTAAWTNNLTINVSGYSNGALLYTQSVVVNSYGPTWVEFDFMGIDTLVFSSYDGYYGYNSHFAMDDFTFNRFVRPITDWVDSTLDLVVGKDGFFGSYLSLKEGDSLTERNLTIEPEGSVTQQGGTHTATGSVLNNGRYRLSGGTFSAKDESIGEKAGYGYGRFDQTGGTHTVEGALTLGSKAGSQGVYNLVAGALSAAEEIIGDEGNGEFNQSGGTNTVAQTLTLAKQAGSHGTYNLTAGSLMTTNLVVGDAGDGTFTQGGTYGYSPTNTVTGTLTLGKQVTGRGTYNLKSGALVAQNEVIGDAGYGSFNQTGGTNTVAQTLTLAKQAGSWGFYWLADGSLTSTDLVVGDGGYGSFAQGNSTYGYRTTNTVNGTLTVARQAGSSGQYDLHAGALIAVNEVIGDAGFAWFSQMGGTNTVAQKLTLGKQAGGVGNYTLSDGSLAATDEVVGDGGYGWFTQGTGTFGYRTSNNVSGTLTLGKQAGSQGNYYLVDGALTAAKQIIGDGGSGFFYQYGGTNTVGGALTVGKQAGSFGEYQLMAGALTANEEIVGDAGQGTFTQGQGSFGYSASNTVNGTLTLGKKVTGNGVYNLIAGYLSTKGTVVGDAGTGAFNQTGGYHIVDGELVIGKKAEGTGGYTLSNGQLSTVSTVIGDAGYGTFTQSGGTHSTTNLTLGKQAGSYGSYTMLNGSTNVTGEAVIGDAGVGVFTQAGGANNIRNLTLGKQAGSSGTYNLRGGNLNISGNIVNGAGTGSMLISGGALNFGAGNHDVDVDVFRISGQGVVNLTDGATATFQKAVVHNGKAINLEAGTNAIFNAAFSGKGPFTGKGTATFNSVLNVGDGPVTFSVAGNMVLGDHSKSIMEIAGDERGSEYDAVDVGGSLTLGGELSLVALDGFTGQLGDVFDLYKAEAISGEFDLLSLLVLGEGLAWKLEYLVDAVGTTDIVRLSVVSSVPLPASVWLLQSALFGLFAARRLRKKDQARRA